MAEFSKLVITKKGQKLIAKILEGASENITFTKICSSDTQYENNRLENLEALESIKQENAISHIERKNDVTVSMETLFTNKDLKTGYYMRSVGLYATDPDDGEILYAVTVEKTGQCYIPAHNGKTFTEILIHLVTTVGNAENVSIIVDPSAEATKKDIERLNDRIDKIEIIVEGLQEDIHGNINSVNTKIGEPTDDHTKQNVFGKIADLKNVVSEKSTETINKITEIDEKVGNISDGSGTTSIFARLAQIKGDMAEHSTLTNTQSTVNSINSKTDTIKTHTTEINVNVEDVNNKVTHLNQKVGTNSDQTNATLFGAIATHKKVIDEINTKLGPLYTDATMVGTGNKITDFLRAIALTQGAVSDAGYTTVFGCLRNLCKHFGLIERNRILLSSLDENTEVIADYHNITIPKTKGNCFKIHTFQPEYNTNIRIKVNMTGKAENMCFYVMDIVPANLMDIADTSVIPFDFQKTFSVYNQPLYDNAQHTQTATIDIILPVVQGRIYHFLTSGILYDDNTLSSFEICYF